MVIRIVVSFLFLGLVSLGTSAPVPAAESRYVLPFQSVMIPPEIADGVFDLFVDTLNREGQDRGIEFVILKTPVAEIDPEWLAAQTYITGELFGLVADSGCCSTSLSLKGRSEVHPAGGKQTVQVAYTYETFFEHDATTAEAERQRMIDTIAAALAERVQTALPGG